MHLDPNPVVIRREHRDALRWAALEDAQMAATDIAEAIANGHLVTEADIEDIQRARSRRDEAAALLDRLGWMEADTRDAFVPLARAGWARRTT